MDPRENTLSMDAKRTLPELLTIGEVMDVLKCSRRKVYDLVERGELRLAYKLFRDSRKGWRWSAADIVSYLDECQARANEELQRGMNAIARQRVRSTPDPPAFDPERLRRKRAC